MESMTRFQRFGRIEFPNPRALPWAITLRAFGAAIQTLEHPYL
jgi:hypothetical protein